MEKIKELLLENPIVQWVENTLKLPSPWSAVALYGIIVLVIVLVIVIICCATKKKNVTEVKEETPSEVVEEPKEEVNETVEEKVEEVQEVEETTEEVPTIEEAQEQVQEVEETKEEAPIVEEEVKKSSRVAGKYVIVQEGPNWRYKLKASNGEVIIVSEPYTSEKAVRNGIETLKRNIEISRCDIVEDKHGLFSFRVITKQGRCFR